MLTYLHRSVRQLHCTFLQNCAGVFVAESFLDFICTSTGCYCIGHHHARLPYSRATFTTVDTCLYLRDMLCFVTRAFHPPLPLPSTAPLRGFHAYGQHKTTQPHSSDCKLKPGIQYAYSGGSMLSTQPGSLVREGPACMTS